MRKYIRFFVVYTLFILLGGEKLMAKEDEAPCAIIPYPQSCEARGFVFNLTDKTGIVYGDTTGEIAYFLQKELLRSVGMALPIYTETERQSGGGGTVRLQLLSMQEKNTLSKESYTIEMSDKEVLIEASHLHGLFYGVTSFLQIVRTTEKKEGRISLPCYRIEDAPLYAWRGFMLDESRHFFGKEKVKQLLDWMAFYKFNRFHWHLTDAPGWRIEIKKYPKLAYIGGIGNHSNAFTPARYYTQEEIKEVVAYAKERFIEIVPEIDMPGHASAANRAYPEFSGGGSARFPEFTFHPGKNETYGYLMDILKEVDALFPSQFIHIGGDEVHFGNEKWKEDQQVKALMEKENLKDLKEVEIYFLRRMADSVRVLNNKVLAWDEVSSYRLPKENTIVCYWRSPFPDQLQRSIDEDYPLILCPNHVLYLDYRQDSIHTFGHNLKVINDLSKIYLFSPSVLPVKFKKDSKIVGIQGNLWTEWIQTDSRLDFMTFPRISAVAETAWNRPESKNIEAYYNRLKKHLPLYKQEGVYYFNPFDKHENSEPRR